MKIKPSKGQSTAGLIMGIIFIGIGIYVSTIQNAGPIGIIWTLMALIITIINGVNAFSDKGIAMYELVNDKKDDTNNQHDFAERLRNLENLKHDGLITEEEYTRKREEILNDKW